MLRNIARLKALDYRSVQYALAKRGWDTIWEHLTQLEKMFIEDWVKEGNPEKLKRWIHDHPHLELGEKSVERLRKMASDLEIKNYSRLSKHRLISAISKELEVATI